VKLVDANVLLHAHNASAPRHAAARAWLEEALSGDEPVALAWIVVLAFLRIATSPRALTRPLATEAACGIVDRLLEQPPVRLLEAGPEHWRHLRRLLHETGSAGNLTTDAHLAALAIEHGATLVTYDHDFGRFEHLRWERPA